MKKFILSAFITCTLVCQLDAQTRYLDDIFDEVSVTTDVVYGTNISILPALFNQPPAPEDLLMDVYEPVGDTETNRPVFMFFHSGNFLPQFVNQGTQGTRQDSVVVEMCERFARMGYVAIAMDHRLGWNPGAASQQERTTQLIQAAYRGVQDSRTAVRFLRKSVAEDGNPFGVDAEKIAMGGDGTGGYITMATSTISSYDDIVFDDNGDPILKFWFDTNGDGSLTPVVIEAIHGNPDGTTDTPLCMANHVGYSSEFHFSMNMGGAMGDLNWLDEGDMPMVSFHCPHDPFAPYGTSIVVVPTTGDPVIEASGSYAVHTEINGYETNNNAVFAEIGLDDPAVAFGNEGMDGLYPVLNNYSEDGTPLEPGDSSPWQWWDYDYVAAVDAASGTDIAATQLALNPTMGPDEAMFWIDQIVDYNTPRMGLALGVLTESAINGGVRYIEEIFDEVSVTTDVVYGTNISILPALFNQPPAPEDLLMDVYEPVGDTETNRPVFMFFHSGNFLPQFVNQGTQGTRQDSVVVEMCERFARMGYVAIAMDHRLGWNPGAASQQERTTQLIQAAYRGVQDSRTAVRFLRKSVAEDGNPFGVDAEKIAMGGDGTGGYITMATSTISSYDDIVFDDNGDPILKFWFDTNGDGSLTPVVIEAIHGNPDGTTDTPLCMANHVGYSSEFHFSMNMGGAMGDLNWLDEGDMPMVSFHCPHDPFAPYGTSIVVVPTTGDPVIEASGSYAVHTEINGYETNNNAVFAEIGLDDPAVAFGNEGMDGLYPVLNNYSEDGTPLEPGDSSPWQWWDYDYVAAVDAASGTDIAATQLALNPTMGPDEAMFWIDQIQDYLAPRMAVALGAVDLGPGCNDENACNYNALATSDDGSCQYAEEGYDCDGNSLIVAGCMDVIACNYNGEANEDDGSCDYNSSSSILTGAGETWLVGLTLTGTENESFAADCEANGGVNPNVALSGTFPGSGEGEAMHFENITDLTDGLLADLAPLASLADISFCGDIIRFVNPATGGIAILVESNGIWITPVPILGASALWVAPMSAFNMGCGDPTACGFTDFCDLSVACDYTDTDGDSVLDCQEVVGCQDESADNYDENATDAGDCNYNGCLDPDAQNYEPGANVDDGSCTYLVSFRVNMSNETVSTAGVHIAGSFQGWDPGATDVPYVGYGVYEVVIQLQQGTYEYKFINGDAWGMDESVGDCGNGGNRVITVSSNMLTSGACFNSCDQCPGCADPTYAEYNPFSASAEGYCLTPMSMGCTYEDADNYDPSATTDDGSCEFGSGGSCPGDLNGDGQVGTPDLLQFLSAFGTGCDE